MHQYIRRLYKLNIEQKQYTYTLLFVLKVTVGDEGGGRYEQIKLNEHPVKGLIRESSLITSNNRSGVIKMIFL